MRLEEKYKKEVIPKMMKKSGYKNPTAVPKIKRVIINSGFGRLVSDKTTDEQKKTRATITEDLALISGQRPFLTKAKQSISGFKLRQGVPIGAKVTLRKKRMYDFLERLINIALPRSKDFWGIPENSIDRNGNLTIGIKEQIDFPEILPEKTKFIFGFEVTVVTNTKNREEGIELFRLLGFPIKTEEIETSH